MAPLLRLFDGKHGLSDVVEESPFPDLRHQLG
jgi:hypothetical protein